MATNDVPDQLKPYTFHGIELNYSPNSSHAVGRCPFCSREKTFDVVIKEQAGKKFGFRCPACAKEGNTYIFLRELYQHSLETMIDESAAKFLCDSRGFLETATLKSWGIIRSSITGHWMVPGHNPDGSLCQLYQYIQMAEGWKLLPTPTLNHYLHGVPLYDPNKSIVALCEGPWDGIALWEGLGLGKWSGDGNELSPTGSAESSALADINVLATPGCNVFHDSWTKLFSDKVVWLMYDSDHPKNVCGGCNRTYSNIDHAACPSCQSVEVKNHLDPAGYKGVERTAKLLAESSNPPAEIQFVKWGDNGFNPDMPSGSDVRDVLVGKVVLA